jgi:hypothetical protein
VTVSAINTVNARFEVSTQGEKGTRGDGMTGNTRGGRRGVLVVRVVGRREEQRCQCGRRGCTSRLRRERWRERMERGEGEGDTKGDAHGGAVQNLKLEA